MGGYDKWYFIASYLAKQRDAPAFRSLLRAVPFLGKRVIAPLQCLERQSYYALKDSFVTIEQSEGKKTWLCNGKRHRDDGPAIEYSNGNKKWYVNGKRHRDDGPAIEYSKGIEEWYVHDLLHRDDGPAIETSNGHKSWYVHDLLHRDDGPAVEWPDGSKEWWVHGQKHRDDGPAIERASGHKEWWVHGERHREDGPAVEWPDGDVEWYVHDKLHRADGSAVEQGHGNKVWFVKGLLHRGDGPAGSHSDGSKNCCMPRHFLGHFKKNKTKIQNMATVDELRQKIREGYITPQTPLDVVKYIGPYLYGRLKAQNINNVREFIEHVEGLNFSQLRAFLTDVAKNAHANQCIPVRGRQGRAIRAVAQRGQEANQRGRGRGRGRGGGGGGGGNNVSRQQQAGVQTRSMRLRSGAAAVVANEGAIRRGEPQGASIQQVQQPPAGAQPGGVETYHAREVNLRGFNALRNLLVAAREEWPDDYAHPARIPREHEGRDMATAVCSCKGNQSDCTRDPKCRWASTEGQTLCVPKTRSAGFEGLGGYSGQKRKRNLRNDGLRFVSGWRVPD